MNRIGIFAGAFDPIHDGHLGVARSALKFLELEKLYFMVEKSPWTEKRPVGVSHRTKMVELATQALDNIKLFDIDDDRFDINKTLPKLEKKLNGAELYFIFGADVFIRMNKEQWPGLEGLLKHYIVVFERSEITQKEITEHAISLGIVVAVIPSDYPHHNSTDVRLKPHEKSIWVPKKVAKYIADNNLYKVID